MDLRPDRKLIGTQDILSHRLGKNVDAIDLWTPGTIKLFEGKISEEDFWRKLRDDNKWDIKVKELKEIVRKNFREIEGTREIIEKLRKKGYKLGLLSVHAWEWVAHCEKEFDYHRLFHSVLYSFEIEVCKPEKRAYELMLEKIRSRADECLFIDDNPDNSAAAEKIGIKAMLFESAKQLEGELKKIKLL